MAADAPLPYDRDGGAYDRGDMEIAEQRSTYVLIMGLTKWSCLGIAALLVFLTLLFATQAGFIAAFLTASVLTAAGVFFLRTKKAEPESH